MKKATVITGATVSGKSWLANNLASLDYKNTIKVDGKGFDNTFTFNRCNENTDCIIIDDLAGSFDLNQLLCLISNGIWVHRRMKDDIKINPKIIVTLDEQWSSDDIKKLGSSLTRRIELIEMVNGIGHRVEF